MTYIFLALLGALIWAAGHTILEMAREAGREEERARQVEKETRVKSAQVEELLKDRTIEDVARDADSGQF